MLLTFFVRSLQVILLGVGNVPRPHNFWFVLLLLFFLLCTRAKADIAHAFPPTAPPTPGEIDPQGAPENYLMFRDDELYVPKIDFDSGLGYDVIAQDFGYPDATLEITASVSANTDNFVGDFVPEVYAARGRVTRQDADQVIAIFPKASELYVMIPNEAGANAIGSFDIPHDDIFLGMDVGDLDKVADSAGNNHDEVVIAYSAATENDSGAVNLTVLNYTSAQNIHEPVCIANATTSIGVDPLWQIDVVDTILDVSVADFDNDGMNEIAVTHLQDATHFVVTTFRYTFDGNSCTLTQQFATVTTETETELSAIGSIQTDVGDMDGDDVTDLVIVRAVKDSTSPTNYVVAYFYGGVSNLNLQQKAESAVGATAQTTRTRVQVATGLFKFDPPNGYDFSRRQVLVGYAFDSQSVDVQAFEWVGTDNPQVEPIGELGYFTEVYVNSSWSIATGAFKGVLAPDDPRWSAAFYAMNTDPDKPIASYYLFDVDDLPGKRRDVNWSVQQTGARFPIVAFDVDSNSRFLGAPVHIYVPKTIKTDYIIYEPPKHTFYNLDTSGKWGYAGQIVNVSRYPDFNVTFTENQTSSFSTTTKGGSDWTIGGSLSASASSTVEGGFAAGIASAEAKTTVGISNTLSYNYNKRSETTDSQYHSESVTYSTTTSADDSLGGSRQELDIWRYRIFGLPEGAGGSYPNAYYDYVIPTKPVDFEGISGLDLDWYQPQHENGNLLSYPLADNGNFQPSDVGTIVVSGTVMSGTLIPASEIPCCGNSGTEALKFDASLSHATDISSSHTVQENFDYTTSFSAESEIFGTGGEVEGSVDAAFNDTNSWSHSSIQNSTSSASESIALNYSADGTGFGYFIYPVMHTTPDGTYKVSHAIQFLKNSETAFWDEYYGQKPDPALNLPNRFYETTYSNNPVWEPKQDYSRKTIRGFKMLNGVKNPQTNENDELPYEAPVAGGPLILFVNVYNYSTGGITNETPTNANNLKVRFEYAPWNGSKETGARVKIGTINLPQVAPMQIVPAQIPWNTTGLGGKAACGTKQYRVIVTLDPNNTIDEIYESENPNQEYPYVFVDPLNNQPTTQQLMGIDPGQNNEGYAYTIIQTPNPNGTCNTGFNADAFLKPKTSLGGVDAQDNKLHTDPLTALRNKPLRLRLKVFSNKQHGLYGHVLIYDGNPRKGGKLIADKLVHFGNKKGAVVWFDWVPRKTGEHQLFAKLIQTRGDPVKNNARAFVQVQVVNQMTEP